MAKSITIVNEDGSTQTIDANEFVMFATVGKKLATIHACSLGFLIHLSQEAELENLVADRLMSGIEDALAEEFGEDGKECDCIRCRNKRAHVPQKS